MITKMLNHLQSAITYAIDLEAQMNADIRDWDEGKWEDANEGFSREFLAAVKAAIHEELISPESLK